MPKKLTQEEFLAKAVAVHGVGRYDYSQTVYSGADNKVIIICPMHGDFLQVAIFHTNRKCGCPKCGNQSISVSLRASKESFVKAAQLVHSRRYSYEDVVYHNNSSKIEINCPDHGLFSQSPANHLKGQNCPHCSGALRTQRPQSMPFSTLDFIKKASNVHGGKYDYSRCEYKNNRSILTIVCPLHGEFLQEAARHLSGRGCVLCGRKNTSKSALERAGISWVNQGGGRLATLYFIRVFSSDEEFFKVGITYDTVSVRYSKKASLGGYSYEAMAQHTSVSSASIYEWEQSILETFAHLRYRPKKSFAGQSECFSSADEILAIFPL